MGSTRKGLWVDSPELLESRIEQKLAARQITAEEAQLLRDFEHSGYIILRDAVPHAVIDALNRDVSKAWEAKDSRYLVQTANGQYEPLPNVQRDQVLAKLLDTYTFSDAAVRTSFSDKILRFLSILFEDQVLAFQNLTFEVGSTQAVHKDGAYVVVSEPLHFAASWVAREDIKPGSGELIYYPGSHKFPLFEFAPGQLHWDPAKDGNAIHDHFLAFLHLEAKDKGLTLEKFMPKKGDALIWHPGLAHGGGPIADRSLTRASYVTHYCPLSASPNYFSFAPHRKKIRKVCDKGYISSWFYDVGAD